MLLCLMFLLTACFNKPVVVTEVEYVYPPQHLTNPTPIPQPWLGITIEEIITELLPEYKLALEECNADKTSIRNLQVD